MPHCNWGSMAGNREAPDAAAQKSPAKRKKAPLKEAGLELLNPGSRGFRGNRALRLRGWEDAQSPTSNGLGRALVPTSFG